MADDTDRLLESLRKSYALRSIFFHRKLREGQFRQLLKSLSKLDADQYDWSIKELIGISPAAFDRAAARRLNNESRKIAAFGKQQVWLTYCYFHRRVSRFSGKFAGGCGCSNGGARHESPFKPDSRDETWNGMRRFFMVGRNGLTQ